MLLDSLSNLFGSQEGLPLDLEADVPYENEARPTPDDLALIQAVENANIVQVLSFLDGRASVNCRGKSGQSPLHAAAYRGHTEVAKFLLDCSASLVSADRAGRTPLHYACIKGQTDCAILFLLRGERGVLLSGNKLDGCAALHYAALSGHVEILKALLGHKAAIDAVSLDGRTALHFAAMKGHPLPTKLLLDAKASYSFRGADGCSALHYAAVKGRLEVVQLFLNHQVPVDEPGRDGRTALHYAIHNNHLRAAELLLERKAKVDVEDQQGRTPLLSAAFKGNVSAARLLLDHGASVKRATSVPEVSSEGLAAYSPLPLITSATTTVVGGVVGGVVGVFSSFTSLLGYGGAELPSVPAGQTALHEAAQCGHMEVVELLVQRGASALEARSDGKTAGNLAQENKHELVRHYLEEVEAIERKKLEEEALHRAELAARAEEALKAELEAAALKQMPAEEVDRADVPVQLPDGSLSRLHRKAFRGDVYLTYPPGFSWWHLSPKVVPEPWLPLPAVVEPWSDVVELGSSGEALTEPIVISLPFRQSHRHVEKTFWLLERPQAEWRCLPVASFTTQEGHCCLPSGGQVLIAATEPSVYRVTLSPWISSTLSTEHCYEARILMFPEGCPNCEQEAEEEMQELRRRGFVEAEEYKQSVRLPPRCDLSLLAPKAYWLEALEFHFDGEFLDFLISLDFHGHGGLSFYLYAKDGETLQRRAHLDFARPGFLGSPTSPHREVKPAQVVRVELPPPEPFLPAPVEASDSTAHWEPMPEQSAASPRRGSRLLKALSQSLEGTASWSEWIGTLSPRSAQREQARFRERSSSGL